MSDRRRYSGRSFHDVALDLTDCDVVGCTFDGCVLTLSGGLWMEDSRVWNCCLVGRGWPAEIFSDSPSINGRWDRWGRPA